MQKKSRRRLKFSAEQIVQIIRESAIRYEKLFALDSCHRTFKIHIRLNYFPFSIFLKKMPKRKQAVSPETARMRRRTQMQQRRENSEFRANETAVDTSRRQSRRYNPEVRRTEAARKRAVRENSEVLQTEAAKRRAARENSEVRQTEAAKKRAVRKNSEVLQTEAAKRRAVRENSEVRQSEAAKKRAVRENSEVLQTEAAKRRAARENSEVRQTEAAKKRAVRENSEVLQTEAADRRKERSKLVPFEKRVKVYEENIKDGPMHCCFSCDRLFFKTSITHITRKKLLTKKGCDNRFIEQIVLDEFIPNDEYNFCSTCYKAITTKKLPKFCIKTSDLEFPEIPDEVKQLSEMEEHLVATRIPFMKIHALGCDRQLGIKGGVINVPVDVKHVITSIPIRPEQTGTIQLKLKRKMEYVQHYKYETIRPAMVYEAAKLLVQTPLYQAEGITLDDSFANADMEDQIDFNVCPEEVDEGNFLEKIVDPFHGTPLGT